MEPDDLRMGGNRWRRDLGRQLQAPGDDATLNQYHVAIHLSAVTAIDRRREGDRCYSWFNHRLRSLCKSDARLSRTLSGGDDDRRLDLARRAAIEQLVVKICLTGGNRYPEQARVFLCAGEWGRLYLLPSWTMTWQIRRQCTPRRRPTRARTLSG